MKSKRQRGQSVPLVDEQEVFIKQIGERLRHLRKEKKYSSYEDFANTHEIDRSQYGKYERGVDMQVTTLKRILTALKVTPKEFFAKGFDS